MFCYQLDVLSLTVGLIFVFSILFSHRALNGVSRAVT